MNYAADARATFVDLLDTLDTVAAKLQASALGDDALDLKLTDDMFSLELQFRVALNQVLLGLIRNCRMDLPLDAETYTSLAKVRERIGAMRDHVGAAAEERWLAPDAAIEFTLPNGKHFRMTAAEHVRDWILPNFYFHATMAYAVARRAGVDLGKFDFVPQMARHAADAPAAAS